MTQNGECIGLCDGSRQDVDDVRPRVVMLMFVVVLKVLALRLVPVTQSLILCD